MWPFVVLKLLILHQKWSPVFGNSLFDCCFQVGNSCVTYIKFCSSLSNQTYNSQDKHLKKTKQLYFCLNFLLAVKKKTFINGVISVGQLAGFDCRSYMYFRHSNRRHHANHFVRSFSSIFKSEDNNKTLNHWQLRKHWVLFPLDCGFASGNIEDLGETKLTVSLGASH